MTTEHQSGTTSGVVEARLAELGLQLPPPPPPGGIYHPVLIVDRFVFVSGHGPLQSDGEYIVGRAGADLTLEQARAAARQVGLAMLATLKQHLGSLDRLERIVKTLGLVQCTPDFTEHPSVINGFSQLMVDLWGDDLGKGARSAVGMSALPGGIAVEIEAQFLLSQE